MIILVVSVHAGSVRRELSSTKAELADRPNMGACVAGRSRAKSRRLRVQQPRRASTSTTTMKFLSPLAIISLVVAAAAHNNEQITLKNSLQTYPGFDLDLDGLRWVQLEGQDPVLMTELEKVSSLIPFRPFLSFPESHSPPRSISRQQGSNSSICK